MHVINSNQDPPVDLYNPKRSNEGGIEIDSLTKEPSDTLLIGDEASSTTPKRENDEFIKSSVDDLVPILRESKVTSVCDDLECDMPVNTPFPTTDVREEDFDINSPLGCNPDSASRSLETSDLNLEELTAEIGLDDSILIEINEIDLKIGWEDEGDGDPFISFHHMPSPRPAAYSPKEVMYHFYHPYLTSGDGFDPEIKCKILYDREDLCACFQSSNHSVSDLVTPRKFQFTRKLTRVKLKNVIGSVPTSDFD
ncbi:hypothetical protein Tco_0938674 [Tanacetum coccineum]|uniref:Uncharacterized protein n=1 Tax=Tanacetum coccineum TaxID=301880 RepID=A0ABQ5DII8_9ASTR